MKKLIIILSLLFIMAGLSAQGPFSYLISPLPENLFKPDKDGVRLARANTVILFKLNGVVNTGALTYNSDTKSFEPDAWIGTGPAFSIRKYKSDGSGNPLEQFGLGAGALLGTSLIDINFRQLRTVLNFEIGNRFSIGYGYAAITDMPNKRHSILFNVRFDF